MMMTGSLWLIVLSCLVLGIAPLWYLYRSYELGGRRIAQVGFWVALVLLGVAAVILTIEYSVPGIILFFIAVLYPVLRTVMDDSLRRHKQPRPLATAVQDALLQSPQLELRIAPQTGECAGRLLQGSMQHWHLHEMDGHDLRQVRADMVLTDAWGTALLDLWLDHEGPVHWRRDFSNTMLNTPTPVIAVADRATAAASLGVAIDASVEVVLAAQERLEQVIGKGSEHSALLDYLAACTRLLSAPPSA
jgi:hypothetical protein